jgi:hypothetical protein
MPIEGVEEPKHSPPFFPGLHVCQRRLCFMILTQIERVLGRQSVLVLSIQSQGQCKSYSLAPPLVRIRLKVATGHADAEQEKGENVVYTSSRLVALGCSW